MRSVLTEGHDVILKPRTTPASIKVQGPWQMTATGLPSSKKRFTNCTAFGMIRS